LEAVSLTKIDGMLVDLGL